VEVKYDIADYSQPALPAHQKGRAHRHAPGASEHRPDGAHGADARGCSLRGALELLIKTGFIAMRTYGFLDKIPKDDWLNLIYNRIGVDARALFKNAQSEAENKA
jgi:hypothetical protein